LLSPSCQTLTPTIRELFSSLYKVALVEAGALRPLVELIGAHALEALLHLIAGLDPAGDGGEVTARPCLPPLCES
jgi:hypothetical protein